MQNPQIVTRHLPLGRGHYLAPGTIVDGSEFSNLRHLQDQRYCSPATPAQVAKHEAEAKVKAEADAKAKAKAQPPAPAADPAPVVAAPPSEPSVAAATPPPPTPSAPADQKPETRPPSKAGGKVA